MGQRRHSNSIFNITPVNIKYMKRVPNMVYWFWRLMFSEFPPIPNLSRLNRVNQVFSIVPGFTVWFILVLGEVILFPVISFPRNHHVLASWRLLQWDLLSQWTERHTVFHQQRARQVLSNRGPSGSTPPSVLVEASEQILILASGFSISVAGIWIK